MKKIFVLLIVVITLTIWKPITNQVPMGEGYYYFDRCQSSLIPAEGCATSIWQYDNLARLLFQLFIPLFEDNIRLYMFAQMGLMITLYLMLFFIISKITKNNLLGFLITLFFIANNTGSFSMMATGNYQRFVQRVPNLIPLLVSYYYLDLYLNKQKLKDICLAVLLFVSSIFLAHHSIFFAPIFVSRILISTAFKIRELVKSILLISVFLISVFLITQTDHFVPKQNLKDFIVSTPRISEKVFLQIPNLIIPSELTIKISKNWPYGPVDYPYLLISKIFLFLIATISVISFYKSKKNIGINNLFKSAVFALPITCFLNLYAYGDGMPHPLKSFGEDRIYFIPSIFSSIMLGTLVFWIYSIRGNILKTIMILIMIVYIAYNWGLINRNSQNVSLNSTKMMTFIRYVKYNTNDKDKKIAIIGHSGLLWPRDFLLHFYNTNGNLNLVLDSTDWKNTINPNDWDRINYLEYNETSQKIIEKIIK